jgi:hypothetical protein
MATKHRDASPHLRVRIEPRLLARLEKAREKSGRTLTGEIVSRLEQSFRREDNEALLDRTGLRAAQAMTENRELIGSLAEKIATRLSADQARWQAQLEQYLSKGGLLSGHPPPHTSKQPAEKPTEEDTK